MVRQPSECIKNIRVWVTILGHVTSLTLTYVIYIQDNMLCDITTDQVQDHNMQIHLGYIHFRDLEMILANKDLAMFCLFVCIMDMGENRNVILISIFFLK